MSYFGYLCGRLGRLLINHGSRLFAVSAIRCRCAVLRLAFGSLIGCTCRCSSCYRHVSEVYRVPVHELLSKRIVVVLRADVKIESCCEVIVVAGGLVKCELARVGWRIGLLDLLGQ